MILLCRSNPGHTRQHREPQACPPPAVKNPTEKHPLANAFCSARQAGKHRDKTRQQLAGLSHRKGQRAKRASPGVYLVLTRRKEEPACERSATPSEKEKPTRFFNKSQIPLVFILPHVCRRSRATLREHVNSRLADRGSPRKEKACLLS